MKQPIHLLAIAVALVVLLQAISVAGTVSAYFEDDVSDPDSIDTYPGIAGDGWAGGWLKMKTLLDSPYTVDVFDTTPLATGTNKYLCVDAGVSGSSGRITMGRNYGDGNVIDMTKDHTISVLFRIDEDLTKFFTSGVDRYEIYDSYGKDELSYGGGGDSTWIISVFGADYTNVPKGYWCFQDYDSEGIGTKRNTGFYITQGQTLQFEVTLHPATHKWDATITDVANPTTTFTYSGMGYRNKENTSGLPQFFAKGSGSDDVLQYSIDSLVITQVVPEPSILMLGLGAALAGLTIGRRRK